MLISGQTYINFNGHPDHFYKCKKRLWQGNPISPLLFNFVADILYRILSKAVNMWYIKELGNFDNKNIFNLHFTDNILLFIQADIRKWQKL
jgi:Reverse transcriptase (RNA-dependent DNA polymerase)